MHVNCIMNSSLSQTRLQEFVAHTLLAVERAVFEPSPSPPSQSRTAAAIKPATATPLKLFVTSGSHSALLKLLADQESCVMLSHFPNSLWAPVTPGSTSISTSSVLRSSNDIIRAIHVKDAPTGPARLSTACTSSSLQISEVCAPLNAHEASSAHRHVARFTLQKSFMFVCMNNNDSPVVSLSSVLFQLSLCTQVVLFRPRAGSRLANRTWTHSGYCSEQRVQEASHPCRVTRARAERRRGRELHHGCPHQVCVK